VRFCELLARRAINQGFTLADIQRALAMREIDAFRQTGCPAGILQRSETVGLRQFRQPLCGIVLPPIERAIGWAEPDA